MNETETKREKIEMSVLSRLQRERRQRAAVNVLRPLIERAKVSAALKKVTLAKAPNGVASEEILSLGSAEDVQAVLAKLTGNGMIRLNASKKYEAAMSAPEISQKEEAKFAAKLLADWPEAERERIVSIFAGESEDGEEDDEND